MNVVTSWCSYFNRSVAFERFSLPVFVSKQNEIFVWNWCCIFKVI